MEFITPSQHYCLERSCTYSAPPTLAKGAAWVEPSLSVDGRKSCDPHAMRPVKTHSMWALLGLGKDFDAQGEWIQV